MAPPLNATFIHRQTLAGQVRFTTTELGELEAKIANAADRALGLELEIFEKLAAAVTAAAAAIKDAAEALAVLDVAAALGAARGRARLRAARGRRARSISSSRADATRWSSRRSPATADRSSPTIATCRRRRRRERRPHLAAHRPEHGGQVDLSAPERADRHPRADGQLRAGAAAPRSASSTGCSRASAPPTTSRAAARPSWSRWWRPPPSSIRRASARSSFSTRSAAAPRPSTASRSPGRRSSICTRRNRCRALFATHFHELTALAAKLPRLLNATVRVKEWQGEVVFLHEVVPGAADRSYGIQVAKLAGLPAAVIERAKVVLAELEAEDRTSPRGFDDLPLFAAAPRPRRPHPRRRRSWTAWSPRWRRSIPTRCRRARRSRRSMRSRRRRPSGDASMSRSRSQPVATSRPPHSRM